MTTPIINHYPYRDIPHGNRLAIGLFKELSTVLYNPVFPPIYHLGEKHMITPEGVVFLSLKQLYIEENDPSENRFVSKWLGNWKQWEAIIAHKTLGKHVREWRGTVGAIIQEKAIDDIKELARKGNFAAAKWLAEKEWRGVEPKHTILKSKTKKAEKQSRFKLQEQLIAREGVSGVTSDMERVASIMDRRAKAEKEKAG